MTDDVELNAADDEHEVRLTVSTVAGGRVRQILVSNVGLLAEPIYGDRQSTGWGSFPMAPWVGRIRNGRFTFLDHDIALALNHQDGGRGGGGTLTPTRAGTHGDLPEEDRDRHAIHGTTFSRPWTVDTVDTARLEMSCNLVGALGWPFAGVARQSITLAPDGVDFAMSVESTDGSTYPASLGWHPWFAKPDRLDFHPVAMYQQDDAGLPTGDLVVPPPGPWDDCFVNHQPIRLHYDRQIASIVTVSSSADHWVVYDGPEHATCVEPQTGPPDALTLRPKIVAPGVPLRMTMRIAWT
jgi:aldose 1-epimerase